MRIPYASSSNIWTNINKNLRQHIAKQKRKKIYIWRNEVVTDIYVYMYIYVFNIYPLLGGPAEEIVGREQSEKLDINKVKVIFQVFKIPVPWVPMLMETKFARLFASDDIFTVKSVLFKTTKKCFFFNSKELRKLPFKTAFAQKNSC